MVLVVEVRGATNGWAILLVYPAMHLLKLVRGLRWASDTQERPGSGVHRAWRYCTATEVMLRRVRSHVAGCRRRRLDRRTGVLGDEHLSCGSQDPHRHGHCLRRSRWNQSSTCVPVRLSRALSSDSLFNGKHSPDSGNTRSKGLNPWFAAAGVLTM
jgi:hypothetical protein